MTDKQGAHTHLLDAPGQPEPTTFSVNSLQSATHQSDQASYKKILDNSNYTRESKSNKEFGTAASSSDESFADIERDLQLIPYAPYKNAWEANVCRYLPIFYWFPRYKWALYLPYDLVAAITAIVMVVPQSMGYAMIAGLPPINGLYGALFGHSLYSLFGTSGQLIVAPVAVMSLMTHEILARLPGLDLDDVADAPTFVAYGQVLSFQMACICLFLGFIRAGIVAQMLAESVIVGFTFAAAILIGISQLKYLLQIELEGEEVTQNLISLVRQIPDIHVNSLILSIICLLFLLTFRTWKKSEYWEKPWCGAKYAKFIPSALIIVVLVTAFSYEMGVAKTGFDIIGSGVKAGLPVFLNFFDVIEMRQFWALWTSSSLVMMLGFIETIAVATKFAGKHGYRIDATQELFAIGICNLVGCWYGIYPIAGVLSLAAVVEAAGALTPMYTLMAGSSIIIITTFVINLFKFLPKPVLGAIVCIGVINLMDFHAIKRIYRVSPTRDFMVLLTTIILTLLVGIDLGVVGGIVGSILMFIYSSTQCEHGRVGRYNPKPHSTHSLDLEEGSLELSRMGHKVSFMSDDPHKKKSLGREQHVAPEYRYVTVEGQNVELRDDMLILRWNAVLFFGNIQMFIQAVQNEVFMFLNLENPPENWCFVFCFLGINSMDYSAVDSVGFLFRELLLKNPGLMILLTDVKPEILTLLERAELVGNKDAIIDGKLVFDTIAEAEAYWDVQQHHYSHHYGHPGDQIVAMTAHSMTFGIGGLKYPKFSKKDKRYHKRRATDMDMGGYTIEPSRFDSRIESRIDSRFESSRSKNDYAHTQPFFKDQDK